MSLGLSLKDFLAVTNLISTISGSLKSAGGSSSDYQELVRELDLLQRALADIEHLTGPPSELPSINAIKCAALNCQYVLDEFAGKLQRFEKSLGNGSGASSRQGNAPSASASIDQGQGRKRKRALEKAGEKMNNSVKKVEWEMFMKEDVRDLRAYLTSHVGSLNMRMITQGLSTASITAKKADDNRTTLERKLEELRGGIKSEFKAQERILGKTNTLLDKVINLINEEIAPQLKEHGTCNVQILDIVKSLQTRIPDPDIRFTWFQDPCRLEDARGHRLPIPSEFGYGLVHAIIKELFKTGPGHRFVRSGDYQLSNIKNSNQLILGSKENSLIPGMNIRMAIVLNRVHTGKGKICPMPHCGSVSFVNAVGGGHTCSDCGVWFAEACKSEKRPHIQDITESSEDERTAKRVKRSMKALATSSLEEENIHLDLAAIKNIRVPGSVNHMTHSPSRDQSGALKLHSRRGGLHPENVRLGLGQMHAPFPQPHHAPPQLYQENRPLYAYQQYFQKSEALLQAQNQLQPHGPQPLTQGSQARDFPDVPADSTSIIEKMMQRLKSTTPPPIVSITAELAQNYAATMAAMVQRAGLNPNMNMNFGNNHSFAKMQPMNIQQMQQMQQMQMQHAARAHAQGAQAQNQTPQHQMFQ